MKLAMLTQKWWVVDGWGVEEVKAPGARGGTDKEKVFTRCECLENTSDLLYLSILT